MERRKLIAKMNKWNLGLCQTSFRAAYFRPERPWENYNDGHDSSWNGSGDLDSTGSLKGTRNSDWKIRMEPNSRLGSLFITPMTTVCLRLIRNIKMPLFQESQMDKIVYKGGAAKCRHCRNTFSAGEEILRSEPMKYGATSKYHLKCLQSLIDGPPKKVVN